MKSGSINFESRNNAIGIMKSAKKNPGVPSGLIIHTLSHDRWVLCSQRLSTAPRRLHMFWRNANSREYSVG